MNSPWVDVAHAAHVECADADGEAGERWGDRSKHGNVPHQRFQHAAVAADGKLLLVGGTDGKLFYDDIRVALARVYFSPLSGAHDTSVEESPLGAVHHIFSFRYFPRRRELWSSFIFL